MIRICILGDIGSGKSHVARNFGYPVFNADSEVRKLYKNDKKIYLRLKKDLPKYVNSFPINKLEISKAILSNKKNLKKIIKIVHAEIRKKLLFFLSKNKKKKFVVLDIPLLLENKINKKEDILIFVQSKETDIKKKLKQRKNFNVSLFKRFKSLQLSLEYKKSKSQFIIKNDFKKKSVNKEISEIIKKIF